MKIVIFLMFVALLCPNNSVCYSDTDAETVVIQVNGLVCDFCLRTIIKSFEKYEEVEKAEANLDRAEVIVNMKPGRTLNDDTVNSIVSDAGYDAISIKRSN